ncbi:MAG: AAA family ATPase [Candidatus Omnitrophica bacterium]|nr:AAA family ATPase [Candidatus Omnitrophota bacterium]
MYFKSLEIVGFKSFMDKTILNFEPGITAIVGPNGCGKSNIFDSIRWVLGEQSAKSLRGSQMEDVIFNGTDTKQPLGMAEVSLTFDNSLKHFPVDNDEVMITRRIFRSGESEYLLNKAQVRLKDIVDMLLGTGIGAESYSIIAQGKIDLILSSRPEERRQVFDEASGITKYKSQKREAIRRLEETEQNLLRLNDIIIEVKRSIGYLERQANKARRYQSAFANLKDKETNLAYLQKNKLIEEKEKVTIELSSLRGREENLQAEIRQQESGISQRNDEIRTLENSINQIKSNIQSLENQIQSNTQHINFNQERIKELDSTKAYLESQIVQTRERLAQDEEKLNKFKEEYSLIRQSFEDKTKVLKSNEEQLNSLIQAIKNSADNISKAKRSILDLATRAAQVRNEITEFSSKQQVYLARSKRLELEKAKIGEERFQVEANLNSLNSDLLEMEKVYAVLTDELSSMKSVLDEKTQFFTQASREIEEMEKRKLSLESQKEFLEKLKSQYEDISESMNAVIYLDKIPVENINGLVIKVSPDPGPADPAQPAGFKLHGEAKPIDLDAQKVKEKLAQVEESLTVLKGNKAILENEIARINGQINELNNKEQDQEMALANKRTVHQTVIEQYNKVKQEEEIILLELSDLTGEMSEQEAKLKSSQERLLSVEEENKAVEAGIRAEQESITFNSQLKEDVLVGLAQVKTEVENLNLRLSSEGETLKMLEDAASASRNDILSLENKVQETINRQQGLSLQIKDLEDKIIVSGKDIESQTNELQITEKKHIEFRDSISDVLKAIEENRSTLETLKEKAYQIQMLEKDLDFKYQSMKERLFTAYKIDLDTVTAPAAANENPVPAQEPVVNPPDSCEAQAQTAPVLIPAAQAQPAEFITDENLLSSDIEKLKEKVDSYGTVNLVAIEEYDELKKRYDFLNQQQNDLVTAKDSLQDAIRKINHTTKKMFLETFERVREEFRLYFKTLFNGGDAQVYLIDENDPLESGIEIICRPPGKKLQNVLLLSGGEKSMSAIALIFAIFKVKPAPFCVLDEIDAALDEANVERFGRVLQEFASTSQFIVVTHNKRTIANAGVMYGITMQESGVSKIVSVKFSQSKPEAQKDKEPQPVAA